VTPDDVQAVAVPVLSVRLVCDAEQALPVIEELLDQTAVPIATGARVEVRA
jgi:hypothetical protein